jgi:predicted nuclease of predicted toxin-antitoxin system
LKLLLDENLSRRLVPFLQADYPGSTQVALIGLESAPDQVIWETARAGDFVIVTRDADFQEMSLIHGQPPKVLWLKTRNPSRAAVLRVLLESQAAIQAALMEDGLACVEVVEDPAGGFGLRP